jgi:hypothetical protein
MLSIKELQRETITHDILIARHMWGKFSVLDQVGLSCSNITMSSVAKGCKTCLEALQKVSISKSRFGRFKPLN